MLRFSSSNKYIVGSLALLTAVVLISGYVSSLWFLRGMWGSTPGTVEFGYQNTTVTETFLANQGKEIGTIIHNKVGLDQKFLSRVAYIKDASGEYIALIPSVLGQNMAKASLQASGWNVHRIGWLLMASKADGETSSDIRISTIWGGIIEEAKAAFAHKLPISPMAFFRTQEVDRGSIAIYASNKQDGIYGTASVDSFDFIASTQKEDIQKEVPDGNKLIVALPRGFLANMNEEFLGSLEGVVAQLLHFQKTTPRSLSAFPDGESIYMAINSNEVALGSAGQGDVFGNKIVAFMAAEQGQRHPKKKAFVLPDGSIGYEYVRGMANPKFVAQGSSTDCLPSNGYDETIFLCGKKEAAVVTSAQDIGRQLLDFMTGASTESWRGYVSGEYPLYFSGKDRSIDFFVPQNR